MEYVIATKASKHLLYLREIDIQEMLASGATRKHICKVLAEKYEIAERTVERQYYQVLKVMGKEMKEGRADLRQALMARNDLIFKKCMAEGKYRHALDANNAQAKLAGLFDEEQEETARPEIITLVEADFKNKKLKAVGDDQE